MDYKIDFTIETDAFHDDLGGEMKRVFDQLHDDFINGMINSKLDGPIFDANGDNIGKWKLTDPGTVELDGPVTIGCPHHGNFTMIAQTHLDGSGCPVCEREKIAGLEATIELLKNNTTH